MGKVTLWFDIPVDVVDRVFAMHPDLDFVENLEKLLDFVDGELTTGIPAPGTVPTPPQSVFNLETDSAPKPTYEPVRVTEEESRASIRAGIEEAVRPHVSLGEAARIAGGPLNTQTTGYA